MIDIWKLLTVGVIDSTICEPFDEYGVSENFDIDFDSWVAKGKPDRRHIYVGVTSPALRSIEIRDGSIVWDTSKLNKIQREHPDMSDSVLRQVPSIIGSPIIVMESKTQPNRVTMYGEVYNENGIPVLAVLELLPMSYGNLLLDTIKVANAYSKDRITGTQNLIDSSDILYVNPDKLRTDTWLTRNQLQLPFRVTKYGSIGKVSYFSRDVNGNYSAKPVKVPEPQWKSKLREIDFQD